MLKHCFLKYKQLFVVLLFIDNRDYRLFLIITFGTLLYRVFKTSIFSLFQPEQEFYRHELSFNRTRSITSRRSQ